MSRSSIKICLMPCRTTEWSSAMMILSTAPSFGETTAALRGQRNRNTHRHRRAFLRYAHNPQVTPDKQRTLPHTQQAERPLSIPVLFTDTDTIIFYHQRQRAV